MGDYKHRIADAILQRKLQGKGAVLVEGPKWCGKTTTAKECAASMLNLGDYSTFEKSVEMFSLNPQMLLQGATPRLIDEWQTIPQLWDVVRSEVDSRNKFGQFILTGSSVPPQNTKFIHSGTGRYARLKMRPMSLFEAGDSQPQISLTDLFEGHEFVPCQCDIDLDRIAYLLCRGGWPQATLLEGTVALDQAFEYYEAIVKSDIQRVDAVRRNEQRVRQLMRSFSRHIGTQTTYTAMCSDIKSNDSQSINDDTVADYIDALRRLFVVEDMPSWNPNIRSKAAIRTSETRYFVDPSIATAALGLGPKDLLNDLKTFGFFFENMAIRDLRVFAEAMNGIVYHYRDSNGLECDAVIHRRDGSYALVEIKLGGLQNIDAGAQSILALQNTIDTTKMPVASFGMVLTAIGDYAYRRKDGVYVVPIGCLKP